MIDPAMMLGGGAPAPAGPGGPGGPPMAIQIPGSDAGPSDPGASGDTTDTGIVQKMLDLADQYRQTEKDEEDRLAMERARTLLQQILAKDQKEQDGMMQGKMSPGAMRRG